VLGVEKEFILGLFPQENISLDDDEEELENAANEGVVAAEINHDSSVNNEESKALSEMTLMKAPH